MSSDDQHNDLSSPGPVQHPDINSDTDPHTDTDSTPALHPAINGNTQPIINGNAHQVINGNAHQVINSKAHPPTTPSNHANVINNEPTATTSPTPSQSPILPLPQDTASDPHPHEAYVLSWADYDPKTAKPRTLRRTPVPTPASLREELNRPQTPPIFHDDNVDEPFRRVLVLHGLPQHLVTALLESDFSDGVGLEVDKGLVDALRCRGQYRPCGAVLKQRAWRRMVWGYSAKARAETWRFPFPGGYIWVYPEVVELETGFEGLGGVGRDGVVPPVVRVIPGEVTGGKRFGVVFCRVGLWCQENGSVVFLERKVWEDEGVRMRKARRVGTGEVTMSFEDVMLGAVKEGWNEEDQLPAIIAEVVRHRWLELYDFLEPLPRSLCDTAVACYSDMMRSLELDTEEDNDVPWRELLERIQRRVALLAALPQRPSPPPPAPTAESPSTLQQTTVSRAGTVRRNFPRRRRDRGRTNGENQRALDRLSYLGGILIPLPIISGILSMGDVYGPDGSKFFVFWAIAVPLAGLTVLLIYADTIRKTKVWVEIEAEHVIPTPEWKGEGSSGTDIGPVDVEIKHKRTVTWRRHKGHRHGEDREQEQPSPRQREDVVFAVDHDVEERMIDTPAAAATAATLHSSDEEVLDMMPGARRWSMGLGWGEVPSVILERPADGSEPKAWRREELGWRGAMQAILWKKFRDGEDVPEGVAACEKPGRRKTNSF